MRLLKEWACAQIILGKCDNWSLLSCLLQEMVVRLLSWQEAKKDGPEHFSRMHRFTNWSAGLQCRSTWLLTSVNNSQACYIWPRRKWKSGSRTDGTRAKDSKWSTQDYLQRGLRTQKMVCLQIHPFLLTWKLHHLVFPLQVSQLPWAPHKHFQLLECKPHSTHYLDQQITSDIHNLWNPVCQLCQIQYTTPILRGNCHLSLP